MVGSLFGINCRTGWLRDRKVLRCFIGVESLECVGVDGFDIEIKVYLARIFENIDQRKTKLINIPRNQHTRAVSYCMAHEVTGIKADVIEFYSNCFLLATSMVAI